MPSALFIKSSHSPKMQADSSITDENIFGSGAQLAADRGIGEESRRLLHLRQRERKCLLFFFLCHDEVVEVLTSSAAVLSPSSGG